MQKSKLTLPTFLVKLLTILENKQCNQIISWTSTQDGFQILNLSQFTQNVLPKYFKHQNFSSFVRQLNMYGFAKAKGQELKNTYYNPLFRRGNRSALRKIQRKLPVIQQRTRIASKKQNNSSILEKQTKDLTNIQQIKLKQVQLEQKFKNAFEKNSKVFSRNLKILKNLDTKDEKQLLMDNIFEIIKQKSNINIEYQFQSVMADQKSIKSQFDKRSKNQESTLQGSVNEYLNLQQFLQLDQFQQLQQYLDIPNFEDQQNKNLV